MLVVFFPWPEKSLVIRSETEGRVDERTIMFSRAELEPGTERFERFYQEFPQFKAADDLWRQRPGLLSPDATFYHPLLFAAADANFSTIGGLHSKTEGAPAEAVKGADKMQLGRFLEFWLKQGGAHSVGITALKSTHLYSVGGRRHNYGKPVNLSHPLAIAFTVEMDEKHVKAAPKGPIVFESSTQYLRAGTLAVQLAAWLRNLGFEAKAHIVGKYDVRCPQVARAAGLGEIGRMGLLMTPDLGPRVRIAVVTTNAPLEPSHDMPDPSVARFCQTCKKCAVNCPAQAISHDDRQMINGSLQWPVNQEKCFTYWCQTGTDCGRCVSVCPYSHTNNRFHRLVRYGIARAPVFRKLALLADDWIYGRKPSQGKLPAWMEIKN